MPGRPPILIVEDDPRLCDLLGLVLNAYPTRVVRTGGAAIAAVEESAPAIALIDLGLPDIDGVIVIRRLLALRPTLPVLVLTAVSAPTRIIAALNAGARGYLFKEDLGRSLIPAVEEILAGGVPLSSGAARAVLAWLRTTPAPCEPKPSPLTPRQTAIITQLARGLTYHEIGDVLGISEHTVRSHVRATYEKLGASNKAEAVAVVMRESWIGDPVNG
ncbi:MAG: two-component response regulator [Deltaproteobacteria bacterium]|nr:two-component response regulator [Deltaproteobacteria bacterium]